MKITEYDFPLPEHLIALYPEENRDSSRLLVLKKNGGLEHRRFHDLPAYLTPGDMVIINNTLVFPARLTGMTESGRTLEMLLVREISSGIWDILSKGSYSGSLRISDSLCAEIERGCTAKFTSDGNLLEALWKYGEMPLPPYIRRRPDEQDKKRYQTVYAEVTGSIAAPTAGLHFTDGLISELKANSVEVRSLTLHVGVGTFRPVRTDLIEDHIMEPEFFSIAPDLITGIETVRSRGNRVITVGTTTTRALEGYLSGVCSVESRNGTVSGWTDIFIREGHCFRAVDALITNFHLPRSTPLMLASAFAGRKNILSAYGEAMAMGYRFFSYGDAMLIL